MMSSRMVLITLASSEKMNIMELAERSVEYSFMTVGPATPLSFSGMPLFFQSMQYPGVHQREFAIL